MNFGEVNRVIKRLSLEGLWNAELSMFMDLGIQGLANVSSKVVKKSSPKLCLIALGDLRLEKIFLTT